MTGEWPAARDVLVAPTPVPSTVPLWHCPAQILAPPTSTLIWCHHPSPPCSYDWNQLTTVAWNDDPRLMCTAHAAGARVVLDGRGANSPELYASPAARTAWIADRVRYARERHLDGINFDLVGGWAPCSRCAAHAHITFNMHRVFTPGCAHQVFGVLASKSGDPGAGMLHPLAQPCVRCWCAGGPPAGGRPAGSAVHRAGGRGGGGLPCRHPGLAGGLPRARRAWSVSQLSRRQRAGNHALPARTT